MLPTAFGNSGPRYKTGLVLPPGPRRIVDDGERARFHIAPAGKSASLRTLPAGEFRDIRRILVVNLDFIGDWVLKTPFLDNLRRNAPQAEITAVVLDRVFDLAAACPFVDRVVSVSHARSRRVVFAADSLGRLAGFRRDYLGGRFDIAMVPRWDADFNGAVHIASASRARHVVGFSERSMARRSDLNRGDDRFLTRAVVDRRIVHEADRDAALIEALGGKAVAAAPRVDFTAADSSEVVRFLDAAPNLAGRLMAVAPFGSLGRTTFPAEPLASIVRDLSGEFDLSVAVIAGPGEAPRAADFAGKIGTRAISAAGALGMRASAALISRATLFVGMDSGPAHVAAAVGTPTAVLSCHPVGGAPDHAHAPERFAPRGEHVLVIRPQSPKGPCVEGCEADEAHCILGLDEETLWRQLTAFSQIAISKRRQG